MCRDRGRMEGWKEGGRMAHGENVQGQRWPDIFFGMGCVLGRSAWLVFQAVGGRGWPKFLEYTKIHNCTGGHKTAELGLTRWVLSARRGLASDPPKHTTFIKSQHIPCDTLQLQLRRSRRKLLLWGTACLTSRHAQICGLTDCPATCSDTMYFASRCQMSTGGWP